MLRDKIIEKIIKKGGSVGACAEVWRNDKEKAAGFILECAVNTRHPSMQALWGPELVEEILRYSNTHKNSSKRVSAFDLSVIKTIKSLRIAKRIKQDVLANALEMTQGNYCKMEKGLMPIAVGQLEVIAKVLEIEIFDLIKLAKESHSAVES